MNTNASRICSLAMMLVATATLLPTSAEAATRHGGGHAGGHAVGHGGGYHGGYHGGHGSRGWGGNGGYYGGFCGPIQATLGLCGPFGF